MTDSAPPEDGSPPEPAIAGTDVRQVVAENLERLMEYADATGNGNPPSQYALGQRKGVSQVSVGSGARLTDEAFLQGGFFPSGSITFMLQDPSNHTVDSETVTVTGDGLYNTPNGFLPTTLGIYNWLVTYSGDKNNNDIPNIAPEAECVASRAAPCGGGTAPEPSSVALVSLALGGLALWRRRKLN